MLDSDSKNPMDLFPSIFIPKTVAGAIINIITLYSRKLTKILNNFYIIRENFINIITSKFEKMKKTKKSSSMQKKTGL